ncbi:nucleotidyltransferase domain-containing protein [Nostoc sp.]|uniref:nucleotidyltransferase domain-containing protein n=1 Tax=Nostoc sp. TaxID=1180 RepID=UPI002FFB5C81
MTQKNYDASLLLRYPQGPWPNSFQELLLKAALWQGQESLLAWREWRNTVDFDSIDSGSYRLLSQLYYNIGSHPIEDEILLKLKGIYCKVWYKNQLLIHQLEKVIQAFEGAEISTLLLKGVGLILRYYQNLGRRSMNDLDLLVSSEQVEIAVQVLENLQWYKKPGESYSSSKHLLLIRHAQTFINESGLELDLHWHILHQCIPELDTAFWQASESLQIRGGTVKILNPSDQLFHVCIHGARWNSLPPLRWAVDAWIILQQSPDLDWQRLVNFADQFHLNQPLYDTLGYLKFVLNAPIPVEVLEKLAKISNSLNEKILYEHQLQPLPRIKATSVILDYYLSLQYRYEEYSLKCQDEQSGYSEGFFEFLKHQWKLDHVWQVPGILLQKGWRMLQKSISLVFKCSA